MLTIAVIGLIGNVAAALIIGRGHADLNIRSAWLHLLGDALSSIGVIISGVIIHFTGWLYADPIAGAIIGIGIVAGGTGVVREATSIFLEMTPRDVDVEGIARMISEVPGVMGIHDLHIWSLAHRRIAFSAHIWVHDQKLSEVEVVRKRIEDMLRGMGIGHILIQFECAECETTGLYCQVQSEGGGAGQYH